MRFCTFMQHGHRRSGQVQGSLVNVLDGDLTAAVLAGEATLAQLRPTGESVPLEEVRLLAPFQPRRIIAVGLNYRVHSEETNLALTEVPTLFPKFSESVIGPGEAIVLPRVAREYDFEAELAFVIGRSGRHIPETRALEHVAGYTCLNDVSARDYQFATSQWMAGKAFDTFCPLGPYLVTRDEVADPHSVRLRLWIDGQLMQDGNTADFIFRIPRLISYMSDIFTLLPGDVVATGTPPGVGLGREPRRWLQPGEVVRIEIDGVGVLENPCRAED